MADADASDTSNKDDSAEDAKEVKGTAPTLDEVHDLNQEKVEREDAEDGNDEADADGDSESDDESAPATDDKDSDSAGDDSSSDGEGSDGADNEEKPEAKTEPAPELDSDITKYAKDKVAIKNFEGKTLYFNNLDEVPSDFEPENYKALMVGTKALLEKEGNDAQAQVKAEEDAVATELRERAQAMDKEWEKDASDLTSAGLLPKDPKQNEAAREEVYDYIDAELKNGNAITSFKQAYKGMMFDREQQAKTEAQNKENDAKKKRGGIVQSGSGGSPSTTTTRGGGKVIQGPPSGASLDAVHTHVTEGM